jgi:hypothetical protein
MATLVENLGNELEQIDRDYAAEFAGQSRLTRDLDLLDRIIKRAQSVASRVSSIPVAAQGPDLARLKDAATKNLELYKAERLAIVRAQETGPVFEQFAVEATSANFVFARYGRHFAGKDRSSRDVALLGELTEELKQIDKRMTALMEEADKKAAVDFDRDRKIVRENLVQYQKEIDLVEKAHETGTPEEQASVLATLANNQFAVYQAHFAGEARVSRRPALMMRLVTSLKRIRDKMKAFKAAGLEVEFNDKNIAVVEDRLGVYETELAEIRKVRQATPMTDIMGELGGSANKLFDEYRKEFADKARAQADADRLANICDKLGEIRRQMMEMSWAEDNEMNSRNLEIVTEQLVMFEGEYEAVVRAKTTK